MNCVLLTQTNISIDVSGGEERSGQRTRRGGEESEETGEKVRRAEQWGERRRDERLRSKTVRVMLGGENILKKNE